VYKSDASTSSFHDMIRELSHLTKNAKPTPFHHMLATLAEEGRLLRLYTQNVDGIDTSLEPLATQVPLNPKGPWPRTIQLHGGLQKMVCTKCSELSDFNAALFDGPKPPACKSCEELENTRILFGSKRSTGIGRLRPRMVLYNEQHPEEDAIGAVTVSDLRQRPDAVVVVGTSLKIPSVRRMVREMCQVTRGRRDGFTAWINCGPEPVGNEFKDCWDLVVRGDCDDVARFASLPEWNDKDVGNYREASHEEWKRATGNTKVEVVVEPKHEVVEKLQGIPTPMPSPRHQSPVPMKTQPKITLKLLVNKSKAEPAAPAKKAKAASSAPKKKPAAKKIPAAKPAKITSMFGVTKAAKTVEKAVDKDKAVDMPATSFYNLLPKQISTPMLPVSPGEVRNNSDAHKHSFASVSDGDAATPASGDRLFTTPPPRSPDMKRETISPTGTIPKNMAHLIDTE
jgi:NAD-dependent histone deacetylase SIR2